MTKTGGAFGARRFCRRGASAVRAGWRGAAEGGGACKLPSRHGVRTNLAAWIVHLRPAHKLYLATVSIAKSIALSSICARLCSMWAARGRGLSLGDGTWRRGGETTRRMGFGG